MGISQVSCPKCNNIFTRYGNNNWQISILPCNYCIGFFDRRQLSSNSLKLINSSKKFLKVKKGN